LNQIEIDEDKDYEKEIQEEIEGNFCKIRIDLG
jgi:hypothetical protein